MIGKSEKISILYRKYEVNIIHFEASPKLFLVSDVFRVSPQGEAGGGPIFTAIILVVIYLIYISHILLYIMSIYVRDFISQTSYDLIIFSPWNPHRKAHGEAPKSCTPLIVSPTETCSCWVARCHLGVTTVWIPPVADEKPLDGPLKATWRDVHVTNRPIGSMVLLYILTLGVYWW